MVRFILLLCRGTSCELCYCVLCVKCCIHVLLVSHFLLLSVRFALYYSLIMYLLVCAYLRCAFCTCIGSGTHR